MNARMIDHEQAVKNLMAERYLLGELNAGEREAYEEHLFCCDACFAQVKAGTDFIGQLRRMGTEESVSIPSNGAGWSDAIRRVSRSMPALVFAGLFLCLAGLSVYQARVIHQLKEPQVFAAMTLKDTPRNDGANELIASPNGAFALRFLFNTRPEYVSYEGQIVQDLTEGNTASAVAGSDKGMIIKKSFFISARDAQDAVTVRLSSNDFSEGHFVLNVFGRTPSGTKDKVASYNFDLRFQR
jgi:Putative zinc-finger